MTSCMNVELSMSAVFEQVPNIKRKEFCDCIWELRYLYAIDDLFGQKASIELAQWRW